jgi:cysteine synthase
VTSDYESAKIYAMRYNNILEAIGHTPLVEMANLSPKKEVRIFAKLEGNNLGGSASIKDRIAKYMIEKAEQSGELTPDKTIIEATSGNTGIALAMVGRRKGYKVKIAMPDNVSLERKQLLELYGAEMLLTEAAKGVEGSLEVVKEMVAKNGSYFMPDQFSNPDNPQAHYETTGAEILQALPDLDIDVLVCGLGTGGTMTGVGKRIKERNPRAKLIGVEPHPDEAIEGLRCLAKGYAPSVLDLNLLDQRAMVRRADAIAALGELLQREGIFAGLSSGAAIYQTLEIAREMERGNIVVILPDGGWKYLSLGIDIWSKGRASIPPSG